MTDTDFQLDPELVSAFTAGALDERGEAVLADQIARLLPMHETAPPEIAGAFTRLISHLGGERELLAWLERRPGRPRLVARLYVLIGLLDRISDDPAVLRALSALRERVPYPPGLIDHLVPDTTRATLTSLAEALESLLAEDTDDAFRLAIATVAMLQEIAPRIEAENPELSALGDVLERVRRDVIAAAAGQ
jgi:hypothetical protein